MLGCVALWLAAAGLASALGVPSAPVPQTTSDPATAAPGVLPPASPDGAKAPDKLNLPQATTSSPTTSNPCSPVTNTGTGQTASGSSSSCSQSYSSGTGASSTDGARKQEVDLSDDHCGPCERFWVGGDYLLWWTKRGRLPVPLLTSDAGVLVGDEDLHYGDRSGGRLSAGMWLDDRHVFGFEVGGFWLERPTIAEAVNSDAMGNPALQRPITNALFQPPTPDTVPVSAPGIYAGGMSVTSASRLWGLEVNAVRNLAYSAGFTADLIFGFRYLDLDENLIIAQTTQALSDPAANPPGLFVTFPDANNANGLQPGNSVTVADGFRTQNRFYGGQIGGRIGWRTDLWTVDFLGKVALGPNHMSVAATGSSTLTPAAGGPPTTVPGGILALPGTNIGRTTTDWFSVAPEVGVQVGFRITDKLRAQVGYSFLYLNNVVRPGDQVNLNINPALAPTRAGTATNPSLTSGPAEPAPFFHKDDFWAHGLNAGLTFRY
jgi:hypothetical protein